MKRLLFFRWAPRRFRWSLLLALFLSIYIMTIVYFAIWRWLGIYHMTPIFADLQGVLAASDCHRIGYDVFVENPCDRWGRPHMYGRLWLMVGDFGLTLADSTWLGTSIVATFILVAVLILNPANLSQTMISAAIVASPPVMLAIERANNDVVVFLMIAVAAILLSSSSRVLKALSPLLVFLGAALKFYPIASLLVYAVLLYRHRTLLLAFVLTACVATLSFIALSLDDLLTLHRTIPRPLGPLAFGAKSLLGYLDFWAPPFGSLLAIAAGLSVLALALWLAPRLDLVVPDVESRSVIMFLMGTTVLLFTFFLITNFSYRMIFFILLFPYLFNVLASGDSCRSVGVAALTVIGLLIVGSWAGVPAMILPELSFRVAFFLIQQLSIWLALTLVLAMSLRTVVLIVNNKRQ
jgi:hypothetical protein